MGGGIKRRASEAEERGAAVPRCVSRREATGSGKGGLVESVGAVGYLGGDRSGE